MPLADALAHSSAGRGALSGAIVGGAVGGRRGAAIGAATGAVVGSHRRHWHGHYYLRYGRCWVHTSNGRSQRYRTGIAAKGHFSPCRASDAKPPLPCKTKCGCEANTETVACTWWATALGDATRIIAVGLVDLRLQHRLHVPRLDTDHW
jgi:hypothetical protein